MKFSRFALIFAIILMGISVDALADPNPSPEPVEGLKPDNLVKPDPSSDMPPRITRWTDIEGYPYIPGTDFAVRNRHLAEPLGGVIARARAAIAACDEESFNASIRELRNVEDSLDQINRMTDEEGGGSYSRFIAKMDMFTVIVIIENLEREWEAEQPCDEKPLDESDKLHKERESIMDEMRGRKSSDTPEKPQDPKIPVKESESVIDSLKEKIEIIKKRKSKLDESFDSKNAAGTLSEAFGKKGVGHSVRNAKAWGDSIWVTRQGARTFYAGHEMRLHESIRAVESYGSADEQDLKTLESGFKSWLAAEKEIGLKLQEITDLYAQLGILNDKRQALNDESKSLKCGFGGDEGSCAPLKQKMAAAKDEFDKHNKIIRAKKDELQEHAAKQYFESINPGKPATQKPPKECPLDNYSCSWQDRENKDIPDFVAKVEQLKQESQTGRESCLVEGQ